MEVVVEHLFFCSLNFARYGSFLKGLVSESSARLAIPIDLRGEAREFFKGAIKGANGVITAIKGNGRNTLVGMLPIHQ